MTTFKCCRGLVFVIQLFMLSEGTTSNVVRLSEVLKFKERIVITMTASDCPFGDPVYVHLRVREGFKLVGYIPTAMSGVTIATGVDLGQQSESRFRQLGVPSDVIALCRPYFGLKTRQEVYDHGLKPENLKLTQNQGCELDRPFLLDNEKAVAPFVTTMTIKGKACLVSLRHWAGHLGNTRYDGKLAVKVNGTVVNFIWNAIKGKTGNDLDLKSALEHTQPYELPGSAAYNRIKHEIGFMNGVEP